MSNEINKYICFSLGLEKFAIPLLSVKEVIGVPDITPVPQTATYFKGIMNLRGSVVTVMDLRTKLSITPGKNQETAVMILDLGDYNLGVVVDCINSVISLEEKDIEAKPMVETSKAADAIRGVFKVETELILLLDIAKALSVEDHRNLSKKSLAAA